MQMVINISDSFIKTLKKFKENGVELGVCETAILNGTPLPKGHGRLIDVDAFCEKAEADRKHSCYLQSWTADDVILRLKTDYAPTVIEAYEENK